MADTITLLHLSDIHLGKEFKSIIRNNPAKRKIARDTLRKAFKEAIEKASSLNPDMIIICGDLFDTNQPLKNDEEEVSKILSQHAEKNRDTHFFLLPGGHDYLHKNSPYLRSTIAQLSSFNNIHIFNTPGPQSIKVITKAGFSVKVHARPHDRRSTGISPLAELEPDAFADFNIAIAHGSVPEFLPADSESDPVHINDMLKFDYVALGHWHSFYPVEAGSPRRIVASYSGSLASLSTDKADTSKTRGVVKVLISKMGRESLSDVKVQLLEVENSISFRRFKLKDPVDVEKIASEVRGNSLTQYILDIEYSSEKLSYEELEKRIGELYSLDNLLELRLTGRRIRKFNADEYPEYDFRRYLIKAIEAQINQLNSEPEEEKERIKEAAINIALSLFEGENPVDVYDFMPERG